MARRSELHSSDIKLAPSVTIELLKVVQCDQTSLWVTSMMLWSEEVKRRLQRPVSFFAQMRYNMSTVLIVLLVLFLLGGGGWGYSRWRG